MAPTETTSDPPAAGTLPAARASGRTQLGAILVARGLVSEADLASALAEQQVTQERLGRLLLRRGLVDEGQLARALADHYEVEFCDLEQAGLDVQVARRLRETFCRRAKAIPVRVDEGAVVVAMANPFDVLAVDDMRAMLQVDVRAAMAEPHQIQRALDRVWRPGTDLERQLHRASQQDAPPPQRVRREPMLTAAAPIVRFVDELVARAARVDASDIHIEPSDDHLVDAELRIRFRIDGVLQDVMRAPRRIHESLVRRVKVMSGLDITETRRPQDGRAVVHTSGQTIEVRVLTMPTQEGEVLVLRLVDHRRVLRPLEELGFARDTLDRFEKVYRRASGTILVTGPTGSGKSTTLYATIGQLNEPGRSVVTVEDPVEVRVPGIRQIAVSPQTGLGFADVVTGLLRADPDVLMVSEVRDPETARAVTKAGLAGHLVLSTLHAPEAAGAPARLVEMGVEPFLVSSSVSCVVAQRLVRRVCRTCRAADPDPAATLERLPDHEARLLAGAPRLLRAAGCADCGQTGYRGRFAIHEVLLVTEEIGRLILERAPTAAVRRLAVEQGMVTLRQDGLRRVALGETTLEELARVVG